MPTIDRQVLQFAEAVDRDFSFLAAHGLNPIRKEATLVRFESKDICINVYHGRQSYEVGLEICPRLPSFNGDCYAMSEIIRLVEPAKADEYRNYAAQTEKDVAQGVQRLASLLRRCVDGGVLTDPRLFERLGENRKAWSKNYAKELNLKRVRQQLDVAWHGKGYAKVIELLEPFRSDLTATELKKLDYAKKQLA